MLLPTTLQKIFYQSLLFFFFLYLVWLIYIVMLFVHQYCMRLRETCYCGCFNLKNEEWFWTNSITTATKHINLVVVGIVTFLKNSCKVAKKLKKTSSNYSRAKHKNIVWLFINSEIFKCLILHIIKPWNWKFIYFFHLEKNFKIIKNEKAR